MNKFKYMKYKTLVKNLNKRKRIKLISFAQEPCFKVYHFNSIEEFLNYLSERLAVALYCKYRIKYYRKEQLLKIRYI